MGMLKLILEEIIGRFKVNRGTLPKHVFFYHSGSSEGRFPYLLRSDIP